MVGERTGLCGACYLNGGSQAIIVRLFHPIFADETERGKAEAAAKKVADAAKTAAGAATGNDAGKKAKEKADEARDEILNGTTTTSAEKQAAQEVAKLVAELPDDAKKEDVEKVADAAVVKASFNKVKLAIGDIKLEAAYEGSWGANLRALVDLENISDPKHKLFNLTVIDAQPDGGTERFLNLSIANDSPRPIDKVLEAESRLVRWDGKWPPATLPDLAKIKQAIADLAKEPLQKSTI